VASSAVAGLPCYYSPRGIRTDAYAGGVESATFCTGENALRGPAAYIWTWENACAGPVRIAGLGGWLNNNSWKVLLLPETMADLLEYCSSPAVRRLCRLNPASQPFQFNQPSHLAEQAEPYGIPVPRQNVHHGFCRRWRVLHEDMRRYPGFKTADGILWHYWHPGRISGYVHQLVSLLKDAKQFNLFFETLAQFDSS